MEGGPDSISDNLLDLHDDVPLHIDVLIWVGRSEVALHLLVAQLVSWLVFAVVVRVLLHRIIDQVDVLILQVAHVVLLGACSNVPVSVEVRLHHSVVAGYQ